ncbi:MAG: HDOD domain-containing protein [Candidatus Kapabacteria bacterium]|jgi:HD-like signal output (HDOD) protein|nr:HDOD domain-containing protein [Candidatus Kapabacteria bacterium]
MSSYLQKISKNVQEFKTLPTVYTQLMEVMANSRSSINDAAMVIASDQVAATKILKVANSPLFGLSTRVDSINKAIFLLGFNEVKNIIIATSIMDMFDMKNSNAYFNPVDFWKYSIGVGITSRHLAKETGITNVDSFFLSGIVHAIGKLFLYQSFPQEFLLALEIAHDNRLNLRDAEREIFGTTHTVVGELLAERWKLPNTISNAIRYYPTGLVNQAPDILVSIVHLSTIVAKALNFGNSGESLIDKPSEHIWELLSLRQGSLEAAFGELTNSYEQSVTMFSL